MSESGVAAQTIIGLWTATKVSSRDGQDYLSMVYADLTGDEIVRLQNVMLGRLFRLVQGLAADDACAPALELEFGLLFTEALDE